MNPVFGAILSALFLREKEQFVFFDAPEKTVPKI